MSTIIAHRGNCNGPNPDYENQPASILEALTKYNVEVDAWYMPENFINWEDIPKLSGWYLGHDKPMYHVPVSFLELKGMWVHIKNSHGLNAALKTNMHYFWHETDAATLTSRGCIWTCDLNFIASFYNNAVYMIPNTRFNFNKLEIGHPFLHTPPQYICTDFADSVCLY